MYYLKDIPFFIIFVTQHEWSCFKHEIISFFPWFAQKCGPFEGDYKIVAVFR